MVFLSSTKNSKTSLVVDSILSYIITNHLGYGDKLPSEGELSRRLGVSRVSVREGLRGLKFLGLLKSTTSRGTELCEMDFGILTRCLGFQIAVDDVSFQQLLEARLAIETSALELICGKLTEEQFSELEQLVDCTRRDDSAEETARDFQTDQSFHRALLKASGNQVLISFASLLSIFFSRTFPKPEAEKSIVASNEHRMLLEALGNSNLDLARGIMKQHLDRYRRKEY